MPAAEPEQVSNWRGSCRLSDKALGGSTVVSLCTSVAPTASIEELGLWTDALPSNKKRRPRLSASMLKSILQKNVRLCRQHTYMYCPSM